MTKQSPHALKVLLLLLALALLAVWLWPVKDVQDVVAATKKQAPPPLPIEAAVPPKSLVVESTVPEPAPVLAGGKTVMQAYRFAMRSGVITLDATQQLEGEFHRRRGPLAWMPGMWCVRVLDAEQRVLAQETGPAPDEPCIVLDPNVTTPAGTPQAAQFKTTDDVMMQVRMPPTPGAKWVKIYRLAGSQPAGLDVEPLGQLLASIPLPP